MVLMVVGTCNYPSSVTKPFPLVGGVWHESNTSVFIVCNCSKPVHIIAFQHLL